MKVSLNWLQSYIKEPLQLDQIVEELTSIGHEVESVAYTRFDALKNLEVAKIQSVKKHPNADKLNICTVERTADATLEIICGAPNVRSDLYVALATVGSYLPAVDLTLTQRNIRGIPSNGMLCSEVEMGISSNSDEIAELDKEAFGLTVQAYYGGLDPVLDIAITPNRPDCLGVVGIARDLCAKGSYTFCPPVYETPPLESKPNHTFSIENAPWCNALLIGEVSEITTTHTPLWMKQRLLAADIHSINLIVDVSNYVMLELSRPSHMYDASRLQGNTLVMTHTTESVPFTDLTNSTHSLPKNTQVITNKDSVVGLPGIIGNKETAIVPDTKSVVIEIADFSPVAISQIPINLDTDARYRFERGTDPNGLQQGYTALVYYLWKYGKPARISNPLVYKNHTWQPQQIAFSYDHFYTTLGDHSLPKKNVAQKLQKLGYVETDKNTYKVPSYRRDITCEMEMIFDVIRLFDFNQLSPLSFPLTYTPSPYDVASKINRTLLSLGYSEVISWSFMPEQGKSSDNVYILNPLIKNYTLLRDSALFHLIRFALQNIRKQETIGALFEIGTNFTEHQEFQVCTGIRWGKVQAPFWNVKNNNLHYGTIKSDVEAILSNFNLPDIQYVPVQSPWYSTQAITMMHKNHPIAHVGYIHPQHNPTSHPLLGFEIFVKHLKPKQNIRQISKYHLMSRDVAFASQKPFEESELQHAIEMFFHTIPNIILQDVRLFDVYTSNETNERSVAFRITWYPMEKTTRKSEDERRNLLVAHITKRWPDLHLRDEVHASNLRTN